VASRAVRIASTAPGAGSPTGYFDPRTLAEDSAARLTRALADEPEAYQARRGTHVIRASCVRLHHSRRFLCTYELSDRRTLRYRDSVRADGAYYTPSNYP
jgi:hypothetical protein